MHWHRSLYLRIAVGLVLFLAAMLVVQAMLFAWVAARSGNTLSERSPGRFSETVAVDLAGALERDPKLDVEQYVREQYAQEAHPFFVMLADNRMITSGSTTFPDQLLRMARARLQRRGDRPEIDRFDRGPRFDRGGRENRPDEGADRGDPRERGGRTGRGFGFVRPTPIVVA